VCYTVVMPMYEVITSSAAVFLDPLALYTETNPASVVITVRLARGIRFSGRPVWRTVPLQRIKVHWIALDDGGYVLPDCVRRVRA
jgi:hypothetical protein